MQSDQNHITAQAGDPGAATRPVARVSPQLRKLGLILLLALVYYLCARAGLLLAFKSSNASPLWLPDGFGLVFLLLVGPFAWPGIALGEFLANLGSFLGHPGASVALKLGAALLPALGNSLKLLAGYALYRRWIGSGKPFEKSMQAVKFFVIAALIGLIGSTIGSFSPIIAGVSGWQDFGLIWITWLLGDFAGVILFAPLLLLWHYNWRVHYPGFRVLELGLMFVLLTLLQQWIFNGLGSNQLIHSLPYLLIPILIAVGLRFSLREAITAVVLVATLATFNTVKEIGPFATGSEGTAMILLQTFNSVLAMIVIALGASVNEREGLNRDLREANISLEKRVAERTRELGRTNAELNLEIGERQKVEANLRERETRLEDTQALAHLGTWEYDPAQEHLIWSAESYRLAGLAPDQAAPPLQEYLQSLHPDDSIVLKDRIEKARQNGEPYEVELRQFLPEGETRILMMRCQPVKGLDGSVRLVGSVQDITERKAAEERIRQLAHHDFLTGLANLRLLEDVYDRMEAQARRMNTRMAVLYLDLDNFKQINDTLGHKAGDEALQQIANRLVAAVREADIVVRSGGDEFLILLYGIKNADDVALVADKVLATITVPLVIGEKQFNLGTSIGISLYPEDGILLETLITKADSAMYYIKNAQKNAYIFFQAITSPRLYSNLH